MNRLVPLLAAVFIRVLHATLRVRHVRSQNIEAMNEAGRKYVLSFWHGHLLMMLFCRFKRPMSVISSRSKDGDISAGVFRYYDVLCTRGSSSKGGGAALREMIRVARSGASLAFTPDGPRGPARVLKEGSILAAQATGLPLIPVAFAAANARHLKSWDRMTVPLPFSRAVFLYGEPIVIPRDADPREWHDLVEQRMNALADEAEKNFEAVWAEGAAREPLNESESRR